jgi:Cft2 family RNA processing exonuclease
MANDAAILKQLSALRIKGGVLFFTIQRPRQVYKGTIILSAVENCCQRRVVYIREYRYKDETNNTS